LTFKKIAANYLDQVDVRGVKRGRKAFRVHLSSLAVSLIQYILMVLPERSWFTGLGKLLQLVGSSIDKVDVSMKRTSTIVLVARDNSQT
jgi:hypothetical protein